ncbi:MAG TPA: Stp1/IreP family PP2C-type Ser/Thr phosphatase [Polyangiaceae bacterium LLY-WYZ-15_(1-7)]|nr:phosphoprotein phosphatase [Myxococcales bacterium]MAT27933.1 phosphoprotein phosphatase [Sandaracinus sp.]HJL06077.1 Stp1/IreP family PP2C-type Ser/Thr phosphatase [Polyangiaceae bacterium LLY-WYZ-15_(1-7)]MBJ71207.1 phosphoprotein phosphatase [Sandaracinus sp.]HJL06997.1 Stp1/IreP family PP2C-type Ser/Thr phosphatase [Polyangiaceae bacterium LLY-WYZ-15_(1-7)]
MGDGTAAADPEEAEQATGGIRFWPGTDVGRVRDHNEDSFLVDKKLSLYIVADGMGGHAAGEVASSMAARTVRECLAAERDALVEYEQGHGGTTRKDILRLLEASVQQACSAVHEEGIRDESKRGMGTTLDALLVIGSRGFIAHVGDARIYLYRQGSVHQLTEDHSLMNELLKRGRLTREQIEKVQYKNAVTRAVGVYESVEVDVFDFDVLPGDRFLLCSDGLSGYLEEAELPKLFEEIPEEKLTPHLIDLANERGGKDNITAVVVRIPDDESGVDKLTREVNLKLDILHKMPLFRFVTYQELVRVLNITSVRNYTEGESVVDEGDEGDELYVVLTGRVKVHSGDTTLVELGPGQHFGEMALVDKAPRSASVSALQPSKLLAIKRRDFFEMIKKDHDVAVKLLWSFLGVLAQRLRSTSRELGEAREQLAAEDLTHELLGETTQVEILADDAPSEGGTDAKLIETAPDLEPVDLDDEPTPAEVEVDVDPKE